MTEPGRVAGYFTKVLARLIEHSAALAGKSFVAAEPVLSDPRPSARSAVLRVLPAAARGSAAGTCGYRCASRGCVSVLRGHLGAMRGHASVTRGRRRASRGCPAAKRGHIFMKRTHIFAVRTHIFTTQMCPSAPAAGLGGVS